MPELHGRAVEAAANAIARSPIKAIYERADDIAKVALAAYFAALDPAELHRRLTEALAHGELHDEGWTRCQRAAADVIAALGLFTPDTEEPT